MTQDDSYKKSGLFKVSTLLDDVTKPIFKKRGFYHHKLLTDWPMIVGPALSGYTILQKIVTREVKGQKEGILYIDVSNSSAAMQLQFMEPVIIEKIAAYFGFKAVSKLRIQQKPSAQLLQKEKKSIMLSDEENQLLVSLTDDIKDTDLQQSLKELGQYILGNNHKG